MIALAAAGSGSATMFSDQFGDVSVGDCHYHLKVLRNGGAIELLSSRQVRGATERIYRLAPGYRWRGTRRLQDVIDILLPATSSPEEERAPSSKAMPGGALGE